MTPERKLLQQVQVCVQLPTSAVKVTLLAFAVECHVVAPCWGTTGAGRPAAAAVDISHSHGAQQQTRCMLQSNNGTNRWQTDGQKLNHFTDPAPQSIYYANIANKARALYHYFVDDVDAAAVCTHRLYDGQQSVTCSRVQRSFTVHIGCVQQTSGTQQVYCWRHVAPSHGKMQRTAASLCPKHKNKSCSVGWFKIQQHFQHRNNNTEVLMNWSRDNVWYCRILLERENIGTYTAFRLYRLPLFFPWQSKYHSALKSCVFVMTHNVTEWDLYWLSLTNNGETAVEFLTQNIYHHHLHSMGGFPGKPGLASSSCFLPPLVLKETWGMG